jgi:hypothetical protein
MLRFEALPSVLPGMRAWGADADLFHFVISFEDGTQLRPGDRAEWVGYSASYKSHLGRNAAAVRIDGLWRTFAEAERACSDALAQLRRPS